MDFSTAEGRGKSSNRPSVRLSVNSMLRRFIPNSKHRGTSTCGNGITVAFDLPEDVGVVELVHELHLLEHVGPVRAVLVHLEHHHLPRRLVRHLKQSRQESQLGKHKNDCDRSLRHPSRPVDGVKWGNSRNQSSLFSCLSDRLNIIITC